jgi:hypothetical protein
MKLSELNKELFFLLDNRFEVCRDNDGQLVIYTGLRDKDTSDDPELVEFVGDHSQRCPTCGEPYEVEVEDGEDCLNCQAVEKEEEDDIEICPVCKLKQCIDLHRW